MAQLISISIDLTKVSKSSIKEVKKSNGEIAKYLNLSISVNDEKDKYDNDCSVSLAQSKEERESKQPKVFLGNGKIVWSGKSNVIVDPSKVIKVEPKMIKSDFSDINDDLPF